MLGAAMLSCPGCGLLTRSAELQDLAQRARSATESGDLYLALELWTQALAWLPPDTVQHRRVEARIAELRAQAPKSPPPQSGSWKKGAMGAGPVALLLLGKGKILLLGLMKLPTLLSMFAFFGVYWGLYGWKFALGIVLTIYVHEMGHVMVLRRYGIPATAPMFIPGLGAFIRTRAGTEPIPDSRVGLAGPIYGLGAAIVCLLAAVATGSKAWYAIAYATGVMNLFNMIPVWQLDGSRGLHSQARGQRGMLLAIALGLWALSGQLFLLLVAIALTFRMFTKDAPVEGDSTGFMQFGGLLAALTTVIVLAQQ